MSSGDPTRKPDRRDNTFQHCSHPSGEQAPATRTDAADPNTPPDTVATGLAETTGTDQFRAYRPAGQLGPVAIRPKLRLEQIGEQFDSGNGHHDRCAHRNPGSDGDGPFGEIDDQIGDHRSCPLRCPGNASAHTHANNGRNPDDNEAVALPPAQQTLKQQSDREDR